MEDEIMRQSELQMLYIDNMQIIKWRTAAVMDILTKRLTTTYEMTNIEFCALQIRKILELIAFSSLVSDMDVYKQQIKKVETQWNAKRLLKDMQQVHPDFYPKPIYIAPECKMQWQEFSGPYLTTDLFEKVYGHCSFYIHENSPFKPKDRIKVEVDEAVNNMMNWMLLIRNLLNTHLVHLYNSRVFYFSMGMEDQRPFGAILERIGEVK